MQLSVPRPFWFAISAAVLLVIAVGLHFSIPTYHQWRAVKDIERYGGIDEVRRVGPEWLRNYVGDILAFDEIESVIFRGRYDPMFRVSPEVHDGCLACVRKLSKLKRLTLAFTNITDNGVEQLGPLPNLEYLDLRGTQITDSSVPLLKRFAKLDVLFLEQTRVSQKGVAELKRALPKLEVY